MAEFDKIIENAGHRYFNLEFVTDFSKGFPLAKDKEGFLHKKPRGGGLKNFFVRNKWSKRRFQLSCRDRKIFYFDCDSGEVKGDVNLSGAEFRFSPASQGKHVFEIKEASNTKPLLIQASSEEERITWVKALLLSSKWEEIKRASEGKPEPIKTDTDIRFSEVLLVDSSSNTEYIQSSETSEEKAKRLKGFAKRNTIAKQMRNSLLGNKTISTTTVSTYKKGERMAPPPGPKSMRDSIVDVIKVNAEIVGKNLEPLVKDSKKIMENASENNRRLSMQFGQNLKPLVNSTENIGANIQENSVQVQRRTSESIRRTSLAFAENIRPLTSDLDQISQNSKETVRRASLSLRKSVSVDTASIRQSMRRSSLAFQQNLKPLIEDSKAIKEEATKNVNETTKRASQRIRQSVSNIKIDSSSVRASLRRSSLAFEQNLQPLKQANKEIAGSVRRQSQNLRRSLSLGSGSKFDNSESNSDRNSETNSNPNSNRSSTRKTSSNLAKFGFKPIEEGNDKKPQTVEVVETSKSTPKAPGPPPPPLSSSSSSESEKKEDNETPNTLTLAVDTDIETKELTVQNQDIEKPEKGESITIEDDKEEIKNEGTDNEEIKITVEEEDNQQDSSNTVVVEEEETQGETNSDLELSDSNRSRSSSSSKSRASIRYLETIQKTVNNIEEKSDAEEPKKREKRVSLAAQRYLAATSIGSLDDKDVFKEEENTDDKDVEVKDEPKIISDVQETEQEVIEGA